MRTPSTLEHVQPVVHTSSDQEQVLLCCGRAPRLSEERREKGKKSKKAVPEIKTKNGMSSGKRQGSARDQAW